MGEEVWLPLAFTPGNAARGWIEWVSSDPDLAEIVYVADVVQDACTVRIHGAGEFTITARHTGEGMEHISATFTLHAHGTTPIQPGYCETMELRGSELMAFRFTAPADGGYMFYQDGGDRISVEVFDSNGQRVGASGGGCCQFDVKKDETYRIVVQPNAWEPYEATLRLDPLVPAEAIAPLYEQEITCFVGEEVWLPLSFTPGNASRGRIEWVSSDPDLAEIVYVPEVVQDACRVQINGEGDFTITATHQRAEGVSTTFTIHAQGLTTIQPGYCETMELRGSEPMAFRFTAPADGGYMFYQEQGDRIWVEVFDSENQRVGASGGGCCQFDVKKDETYRIVVQPNAWEPYEATLCLKPLVPVEAIAPLYDQEITCFVGEEVWLPLAFTPGNASRGRIDWVSSNPELAEIVYVPDVVQDACRVQINGEGDFTITATHQKVEGVSTTFTLHAHPVGEWDGAPRDVTVAPNGGITAFRFTVPSDGEYVIYDERHQFFGIGVSTWNQDGQQNDWGDDRVQFYAQAGQTCRVEIHNWNEEEKTGSIRLAPVEPATGIRLNVQNVNNFVGGRLWLNLTCEPLNADLRDLKWFSSNSSVVRMGEGNLFNREFLLVGQGTATITAKLGDLEASCKVVVTNPISVSPGYSGKITLEGGTQQCFRFTPGTTGKYAFYNVQKRPTYQYVLDETGAFHGESGNAPLLFDAEAGTTYYIYVVNYLSYPISLELRLSAQTSLTGIQLDSADEIYVYPGTPLLLSAYPQPQSASLGAVKWEILQGTGVTLRSLDDPSTVEVQIGKEASGDILLKVTDLTNGYSDTLTLHVKSIGELTPGQQVTVKQHDAWENSLLRFTPAVSGPYVLRAATNGTITARVYPEGTEVEEHLFEGQLTSGNQELSMYLEAGIPYLIDTNLQDLEGTYGLTLEYPNISATPIFFMPDHVTLKTDETMYLMPVMDECVAGLPITWKVDGKDITEANPVVSVENEQVTGKGIGTAYVTASVTLYGRTYTAQCRVDVVSNGSIQSVKLGSTSVTTELFRWPYAEFDLLFQKDDGTVSAAAIQEAEFADETVSGLFELVVKNGRTLYLVPTDKALEAQENPKAVGSKYTSAVKVTVANGDETTELTTGTLTINVKKSKPNLKAAAVTLNPFYPEETKPLVLTGATGWDVEDVALPESGWLTFENNAFGLVPENLPEKPSQTVTLWVKAEGWAVSFPVNVSVKAVTTTPKLKLSATTMTFADSENSIGLSMKLLCGNKKETLSGLQVKDIQVCQEYADSFEARDLNLSNGSFVLAPIGRPTPGSIQLEVTFGNTNQTLTFPVTVKTTAVKLSAKPTSVTLNSVRGDGVSIPLTFTPADYVIENIEALSPQLKRGNDKVALDELDIRYEDGALRIDTVPETEPGVPYTRHGATYTLSLFPVEGGKATKITVKTLAENKSTVTVTAKAVGTLDLAFPDQPLVIRPVFKNLLSGSSDLEEYEILDKGGKRVAYEDFNGSQNDGTNRFELDDATLQLWSRGAQPGSYTLKLTFDVGADYSPQCSVKFTVKRTAVKLKLAKTSLTLNSAIAESNAVALTCLTKGYDFVEPAKIELSVPNALDVSFAEGLLQVAVNKGTPAGTYKVNVFATEADTKPTEADAKPTVTLNVKVIDKAVTASLKATGYLDVLRAGSTVTVKPTYSNFSGFSNLIETSSAVEMSLDKWKTHSPVTEENIQIDPNGDGTFTLRLAEGYNLNPSAKYRFKLTVNGKNFYTNLTVKLGSAKLSAETALLYRDVPTDSCVFRITTADETLNPITDVTFKDPKQADLYKLTELAPGVYTISFQDGIAMPKAKTYSIVLNVAIEGYPKPITTATLKLQISQTK